MANYTGFLAPKVALFSNIGADGGGPAVAAAGPVPGGEPVSAMLLNRLLSHDLPRSRWLALAAGADRARPGARAVPLPRRQGAQRGRQDAGLHRAGGELRPAARLHRHRQLRAHDVLRHRRLRRRDRQHAAGRRLGAALAVGVGCALALSLLLSLLIGLFSLRVQGDLLRHDHAGRGLGLPDAGVAAVATSPAARTG